MSDGIEITVQIRARGAEVEKDLPTYFTESESFDGSFLQEFNSERVVEETMKTAVRKVVAEWSVSEVSPDAER